MRTITKPVHIRPEQIEPGDMIETRYESEGVRYSTLSYVGLKEHALSDEYVIYAANNRTVLIRYRRDGIFYPSRQAVVYRHRTAPKDTGLF